MENKLDDVVVNLAGKLLLLDLNEEERLISMYDLVDTYKAGQDEYRGRGDTSSDLADRLLKSFVKELQELADYAKEVCIEKRTLQ